MVLRPCWHFRYWDGRFTNRPCRDGRRRFKPKGVSYNQRVAVKGEPGFVKVIVYDYAPDLTGTALVMIPGR